MLSGWFARIARVRVTACYAVLVAMVAEVLIHVTPDVQDAVIRHASTNLHNLGHGRIGTLVSSAFVVDAGPVYLWLPGLICLLAAAEMLLGSRRLVIAAVAGHVGATLLVALGLAAAVRSGWIARSVAHASDVGMSYVVMGVVGALSAAIPSRWRPLWQGWWLTVAAVVLATGPGFTDIGHVVALTLGMLVAPGFGTPRPLSVPTGILVTLGASFGYLVLAEGLVSGLLGAAWGVVGALACQGFARLQDTRKGHLLVGDAPSREPVQRTST